MSEDKHLYTYKIYKYKGKILKLLNQANYKDVMTGNGKKYENIVKNKNLKVYESFGTTNIVNSKISLFLEINGSLTFKNLDVNKKAITYGSINGIDGKFYYLIVYGDVRLSNCIVNDLYVFAPSVKPVIILNNCKINKLIINNDLQNWYPILKNTIVKILIVQNKSLEIILSKNSNINNMENASVKK